jgi:pimeloyl-ACP methyl ester carboxylesterase
VPGPMSEEGLKWVEENLVRPVRARGMVAILELAMDMEGDALPEWTRRQIMETDPAAFVATAIGHSRHPGSSSDELASLSMPVLLITGEREDPDRAAEREARNIPGGSAAVLPGLNHIGAFDRSDLTVPIFRRFLDQHGASVG